MPIVINTNTASITAQRHLDRTRSEMEQAMERLSSGKRINSAMDDAAGLTISHSLDSKITSLNQATRNANDGISLINLAEGALDEVTEMLIRMRELAIQSKNGTYSEIDRANLDLEFQKLNKEIIRIKENTFFNGIELLNSNETVEFQVGDKKSDQINLRLKKLLNEIENIQSYIASELPVSQQYEVKVIGGEKHYTFDSNPYWTLSEGRQASISINGSLFVQEFQNNHTTTLTLLADKIKNSGLAGVSTANYNLPGRSGDLFITTDNVNTSLTITDLVNSPIGSEQIKSRYGSGLPELNGVSGYKVELDNSIYAENGEFVWIFINGIEIVQEFITDAKTTINALVEKINNANIVGVDRVTFDEPGQANELYVYSNANDNLYVRTIRSGRLNEALGGIKTDSSASYTLDLLDESIGKVDFYRASLGAVANRLNHAANNLMTRVENQIAARSRIEDADYAVESANLAKAQVLQQSGTAMLSQANASTQNVLDLLK